MGVLRGGPSDEYEVSLKTGHSILEALKDHAHYAVQDIFIDRQGNWHINGVVRPIERVLPHIDVAVNALHGRFGEDGRVQQLLDTHKVPYTGAGAFASALAMNKHLSKKFYRNHGLLVPEHVIIKKSEYKPELLLKIIKNYPHLRLVKPATSGSSLGVTVINTYDELEGAVQEAFKFSDMVMVEEFIKGREATCGVVEGENETYALHPIEIRDLSKKGKKQDVWGYASKYSDDLHELICPGDFTEKQTRAIQKAAVDAHKALGLRHYSRSDFMINKNGVYILETNTLPGLTKASLFPRALAVAGITLTEFLDHLIKLAVGRKK